MYNPKGMSESPDIHLIRYWDIIIMGEGLVVVVYDESTRVFLSLTLALIKVQIRLF